MGTDAISAVSMTAIGDKLKEAREKKALTVDQVQKQTRIHSTVIRALEEGRCDEMLTATYVKSFLKKYADHLGLNSRDMIREYSILHREIPAQSLEINAVRAGDASRLMRWIVMSGLAVLAAAFVFFLFAAGGRFVFSLVNKASRSKAVVTAPKAKDASVKAAKKTEGASQNLIPRSAPLNVVLKVKSPVWVELKKDGEKQFKTVLRKAESIQAREKVEFFVANGEAIEIFINGRSFGSPGKGLLKNVVVTRNGVRVR